MENKQINVLLIEDNPSDIQLVQDLLSEGNGTTYQLELAEQFKTGMKRLNGNDIDVVLINPSIPDCNSINTFQNLLDYIPEIPVLVFSDNSDDNFVSKTLQSGAQDYLIKKELNKSLFMRSIRNAIYRQKVLIDLRHSSHIDELTGIYNRRGFYIFSKQQMDIYMRHIADRKIYILSADMDNFKFINDTYGHNSGDFALKDAASILNSTFRDSDIIGRVGGDEFAILTITSADADENVILDRLDGQLKMFNEIKGRQYQLSMSIGAVEYNPEKKDSMDDLLLMADSLMYKNKQSKKDAKV